MSLFFAALFWYLSIGAMLALAYNFCDRESGPMRRSAAILFSLTLWLPALICAIVETQRRITK